MVEVVEIDDVRLQGVQRDLALLAHVSRIVEMIGPASLISEFRREEDLIPRHSLGEYLTDESLRVAVAIGVGRIPMRDPLPMRFDECRFRQRVVVTTPSDREPAAHGRAAMPPRAE